MPEVSPCPDITKRAKSSLLEYSPAVSAAFSPSVKLESSASTGSSPYMASRKGDMRMFGGNLKIRQKCSHLILCYQAYGEATRFCDFQKRVLHALDFLTVAVPSLSGCNSLR